MAPLPPHLSLPRPVSTRTPAPASAMAPSRRLAWLLPVLLSLLLLDSPSVSFSQALDRDSVTWRLTFQGISDASQFSSRLSQDMTTLSSMNTGSGSNWSSSWFSIQTFTAATAYVAISIPAGTVAYADGVTPRSVYASLVSECCLSACVGSQCNANSSFYSDSFLLLPNSTSFALQCCDGSYAHTVDDCPTCTGSTPTHYTTIIGGLLAGVFGSIVAATCYIVWKRRKDASVARHRNGMKLNDARMVVHVPGAGAGGGVLPLPGDDDVSPLPSGRQKKEKARKSSIADVEIHVDGLESQPPSQPPVPATLAVPVPPASAATEEPPPPKSPRTPRGQIPVIPPMQPTAAATPAPAVSGGGAVAQQAMGPAPVVPPLSFPAPLGSVPDASPQASPKPSPPHSPKTSARRPHVSRPTDSLPPLTKLHSIAQTAAERMLQQGREAAAVPHRFREEQPQPPHAQKMKKGKDSRRGHGRDGDEQDEKKEEARPRPRPSPTRRAAVEGASGDEVEEKER